MRRAFTLIEMLVVITIIMALMALLLPALAWARDQAHWVDCQNRVELIRQKLSTHAAVNGSIAAGLQRATAMPGAIRVDFQLNSANPDQRGIVTATEGAFLSYNQPWQLRFPLGEEAAAFWADTPYMWNSKTGKHSNWDFVRLETKRGIDASLADFTTDYSASLAVAIGLAPDEAAYRDNRDPAKPWNDPWGNPLILALALFQYGPETVDSTTRWPWIDQWPSGKNPGERAGGTMAFTEQWRRIQGHYGTTRRLYVSIAAVGTVDPGVSGSWTDAHLQAAWSGVRGLCDTAGDGTDLWRVVPSASPPVNALVNPPWEGLRRAGSRSARSLIAAPLVVE